MRTLLMAAAAAALLATPTLAAKKAAANTNTMAASTTASTATTAKPAKAPSKLKVCATQWDAMTPAQKDAYKTKAATMKSKKGGKLSGYNAFTGECMKKA